MDPKAQFGGFQTGLVKVKYQVASSVVVAKEPRKPTINTINIDAANFPIPLPLESIIIKKFTLLFNHLLRLRCL